MAKSNLRKVAYIREAECIGCTKCIVACPFDAIVGSAKWMHTVLVDECIGCKLCLPPCPVDCIEMVSVVPAVAHPSHREMALHAKERYQARKNRLAHEEVLQSHTNLSAHKHAISTALTRIKKEKMAKR
jgi:electron transport complex protein RnfB